ncbi:hypothetical protein TSOC_013690, partial [Tetrabaena socialis]
MQQQITGRRAAGQTKARTAHACRRAQATRRCLRVVAANPGGPNRHVPYNTNVNAPNANLPSFLPAFLQPASQQPAGSLTPAAEGAFKSTGRTVVITGGSQRGGAGQAGQGSSQENQSRFVGSLKKQFVEQEAESLQQRTSAVSRNGQPYAECL